VPLHHGTDLDAFELRGRRVEDATFKQFDSGLHIWVDGHGVQQHPKTTTRRPGTAPDKATSRRSQTSATG